MVLVFLHRLICISLLFWSFLVIVAVKMFFLFLLYVVIKLNTVDCRLSTQIEPDQKMRT